MVEVSDWKDYWNYDCTENRSITNQVALNDVANLNHSYRQSFPVNPVTTDADDSAKSDEKPVAPKKEIKQLQIGIKKKVPDCVRRSKANDVLHIHYEVYLFDVRDQLLEPLSSSSRPKLTKFLFSKGKLLSGEVFDSSLDRGEPLSFTLGTGQVIKGWDQGLIGICEGEKRKLIIPADLAYGSKGAGAKIPPNSPLIFEVECVKIEDPKQDL